MRASPKLWSMGLLAASVLIGLAAGWFVFGRDLQPNAASTALPVFALVTTPTFVHGAPAPVVGAPVPDFTLAALDGSSISLSDFAGQPVLINFWATWCAPCRLEMPELVRVYEAHKADGFVLLAVNLTYLDVREDVQPYVDEFSMTFPVLFDEDGTVASDLYRMRGQPLSVFVNRDGLIASIRVGAMTPEIVDEYVAEILK